MRREKDTTNTILVLTCFGSLNHPQAISCNKVMVHSASGTLWNSILFTDHTDITDRVKFCWLLYNLKYT